MIQAGSGRVEALASVARVMVEPEAQRPVGSAEHDCVPALVAAMVRLSELALQAQHLLVPGGSCLHVGDREAHVVDTGKRRPDRTVGCGIGCRHRRPFASRESNLRSATIDVNPSLWWISTPIGGGDPLDWGVAPLEAGS
jgi:hypothetical protein